MSEVVRNLFVGNAASAMYPEVAQFDVIVNVTREVPFSKFLHKDQLTFRYSLRFEVGTTSPNILDVAASDQDSMVKILKDSSEVIRRSLESNSKVLVHCLEGKCRSVTVVCHFLMRHLGMTFEGAREHLRLMHKPSFDYGTYVHYEDALKRAPLDHGDNRTNERQG